MRQALPYLMLVLLFAATRLQAQTVGADTLALALYPDSVSSYQSAPPKLRQPVWLVRTNIPLLFTGFTPNFQAELSLDHKDRWSLNLEGIFSWWTFSRNAYANQLMLGTLELRRWLGSRWKHHTLDGWHIGLAVGGGYGDVEWKSSGYQAEVMAGYINIGWQRRFGRRRQWAIDLGAGVGYAHIPYRRYDGSSTFPVGKEEEYDDHLMWQESSRTNWFGATHLNISIGYVFNQRDAAWKRRKAMERDAERNDYLHFRDSLKAREVYERDSARTALKLRINEAELLPKAERKAALAQIRAEQKQAKAAEKSARKQAKLEEKEQKKRDKAEAKLRKQHLRDEKMQRRTELQSEKAWENSAEGKAAAERKKADEKRARQQARQQAKTDKKQRKAQRREERMRARIAAEQQRNRERLQREMEKADQKYGVQ
ncbi:MAG: DUF3575 domain-containing protein [Prevotella sp.]|nr:DUF3575 domain-containing protein [Prevotella sp.]